MNGIEISKIIRSHQALITQMQSVMVPGTAKIKMIMINWKIRSYLIIETPFLNETSFFKDNKQLIIK